MSESVSNAEIEDVLTSIRRLVSGEEDKSAAKADAVAKKPSAAAKLILTADFRVSDAPKGAANAEEEPAEPATFRHAAEPEQSESKAADSTEKQTSLESTIAELEAAIGEQDEDWEPDGSEFEEDAEAEAVMTAPIKDMMGTKLPIDEIEDAEIIEDDLAAGLFAGDDPDFDEEALREMVSEIVRQELQGALGERITRNVRKLVRREINRVLAAQDFD
ncbi:hypothetical protein [Profundibacter sp.]|uniref:hypothetical protein n=1 Tax=Profundibacter sp. TaxID=3101071 RepID=UPI003D11665B